MNNDLISRTELKKCAISCEIHNGILTDMCVPLYQIDNAPTIDAYTIEDVRDLIGLLEKRPTGEWIREVDEVGFVSHICSNCGAKIEVENCSDDKFCFNCGAEMRGKEE